LNYLRRRSEIENRQRPVARRVETGVGKQTREVRSDQVRRQLGRRLRRTGTERDLGRKRTVIDLLLIRQ